MRIAFSLIIILFGTLSPLKGVLARVYEVNVTDRSIVADGALFGPYGTYERLKGTIVFKFDPENEKNWNIIDLEYAPLDDSGMVTATANFMVLQPSDPILRRELGFLEISNRGRKLAMPYFNAAEINSSDPIEHEHLGDGLLLRQGLTIVWVGWQYDIPQNDVNMWLDTPRIQDGSNSIKGLVRSDWVIKGLTPSLSLGHRGSPAYYLVDDITSPNNVLTYREERNGARTIIPKNL